MKIKKFQILIILLFIISGCEKPRENEKSLPEVKSEFKVKEDYSNFSKKLENGDTLSMIVNLSVCMWEEYDLITFTKKNDDTYLQINKIVEISGDTLKFPQKTFNSQDGEKLENLISEFDINNKEKINSPFFIISNYQEKDTVLLRTTGLTNRINKIEKYQNLISDLYTQEMNNYKEKYQTPPPPPPGNTKE